MFNALLFLILNNSNISHCGKDGTKCEKGANQLCHMQPPKKHTPCLTSPPHPGHTVANQFNHGRCVDAKVFISRVSLALRDLSLLFSIVTERLALWLTSQHPLTFIKNRWNALELKEDAHRKTQSIGLFEFWQRIWNKLLCRYEMSWRLHSSGQRMRANLI